MNDKKNEEKLNKKPTEDLKQTLDELEELTKQDDPNVDKLRGKIEKFKDGIELLHGDHITEDKTDRVDFDEKDDEEEPLTIKELKQLYRYVNNVKYVSNEEVEKMDQDKIDRMVKISQVMIEHMPYTPKKHFGVEYKKERKRKNREVRSSRKNNR